ncbi:YggS family pyridoxal phosphate-dependent enzyme [Anaerosalibacter bizertensis]|uniref:YggS family pyridoxal phosphate-dependent enzyme n=1 Tax=Anaerosalibacter bizertensis TaxID=932217 RepID=UPI001C0F1B57|nr:YggS family pyridoxal phosphate-dependent enzyme [Anaerosalibacter bizertensis]MBU5293372.1 YggS family pyridoxal phosphate-dependent enzyme [Anaerosalibacter bizertensis]MBV1816626.1 YggS family pyridoxal phosphate-dependent enzyme [Bacteroidales bacterium MSK.15.36]
MNIKENLLKVQENIENALIRSGRKNENIDIIAVTKTVDVDIINESINLGINNIGENKVQEIQKKYDNINDDVNWHMIGHLQSNKVKYIIDKVNLIHSLDRLSLAKEINKRAKAKDIVKDVLIQVNISEEKSKFGLKKEEVVPFIEKILEMENIRVKGLMTMAPHVENPEEIRYVFRDLRNLGYKIENRNYENIEMKYLSMGMSNDYEVAIEEGSNMVRLGTALFGKRIY